MSAIDGAKTYRMVLPADIPAATFWSTTDTRYGHRSSTGPGAPERSSSSADPHNTDELDAAVAVNRF
jgi:hypothetical protein